MKNKTKNQRFLAYPFSFQKNKRGFLLGEETVKIIIAVIAIGFLVYLLVSIYFNSQKNEKLEQAGASVDYLVKELSTQSTEIELYNPKGWVLISWPFEGVRPQGCSNFGWENCVCICEDVGVMGAIKAIFGSSVVEQSAEKCDSGGVCLNYGDRIIVGTSSNDQRPIGIAPPLKLNVDYSNEIIITEK